MFNIHLYNNKDQRIPLSVAVAMAYINILYIIRGGVRCHVGKTMPFYYLFFTSLPKEKHFD